MTLYRKYRSQKLSEIVGQPQVASVLSQAISRQRIAHAYLLAGPRGTGKTSVARIVAKAINCLATEKGIELPCNECANCLAITQGAFMDVIEIDAASNRGVDEARELRERVHIAPSLGKYKVYILDEVHMLTNEAFNTLLKTLEEPPAHVIFILCTTESHKVPITIASRCQRFVFTRAQEDQLQQHLQAIAKAEGVAIDAEALMLLAQLADGGYRDGIMLLEQVITAFSEEGEAKPITRTALEAHLGLASLQVTQAIIEKLIAQDASAAVSEVELFVRQGGEVRYLTADLINLLRQVLLYCLDAKAEVSADSSMTEWLKQQKANTSPAEIIRILKSMVAAQQQKGAIGHAALPLEMAIIESLSSSQPSAAPAPVVKSKASREYPMTNPAVKPAEAVKAVSEKTEEVETPPPTPSAPLPPPADLVEAWQRILQGVLAQNKSIGSLLRHHSAPVSYDGKILLLQFWNSFHKKQVETDKNRVLVENIAVEVMGQPVKLRGELADKSLRPKKQPMSQEDLHNVAPVPEENLAETAAEIFGGEFLD